MPIPYRVCQFIKCLLSGLQVDLIAYNKNNNRKVGAGSLLDQKFVTYPANKKKKKKKKKNKK